MSVLTWLNRHVGSQHKGVLAAWSSRVVMALVQIISIRILSYDLELKEFAVYSLVIGLAPWYLLADFGIGPALQNHISKARMSGRQYRDIEQTIFFFMLVLLSSYLLLLYLLAPFVANYYLLPMGMDIEEGESLIFASGSLFLSGTIGGVLYRVWYAEQNGVIASVVPSFASVLGLMLLFASSKLELNSSVEYCVVAFCLPTSILPLAFTLIRAARVRVPRNEERRLVRALHLVRGATGYWSISLVSAMSLQIDYLVISQFLGPAEVVTYSLTSRVFWFVLFFYGAALTALWPLFAESILKDSWHVVRRLTTRYLLIGAFFAIFTTLAMVLFSQTIIGFIAPNTPVQSSLALILLFGAYQIVRIWSDTFLMILQSMGNLKPIIVTGLAQAVFSIILQICFVSHLGLNGLVFANIVAFLATSAWLLPKAVYSCARGANKMNI